MAVDKKTYNAIKNHLISKRQIVLSSFTDSDIADILKKLKDDGLNVSLQGNKILLTEQTEVQTPKEEKKTEVKEEKKVEVKEEVKLESKPEAQPVVQQQVAQEEKKQRQKRSLAIHIRLPIEYTNYIHSVNENTTFALKLIIYEHAKTKGVTLPEPRQIQNGITKKERKELKECLKLETKEAILQCLQQKLT